MMNYKRSVSGGAPPVPPQRHSSIRANAPVTPPAGNSSAPAFGNSNMNTVGRLVIDLESKFGKRFHNVTEFPKPPPFVNIPKVYPSRTIKATNAPNNSNNNNCTVNIVSPATDGNNGNNITSTTNTSSVTKPPVQPAAYHPFKKHRAPAPPPPPQAGVAAATVSVIRQSSFLAVAPQTQQQQH